MTALSFHSQAPSSSPQLQRLGLAPQAGLAANALPAQQDGVDQSVAISVQWARTQDDMRAAQRLRYQVFCAELGAQLPTTLAGHDLDLFDDFCEHLLVRDSASNQVIGTYRVLTPAQAKRIGSTYSDTEFDLTRLRGIRSRMVELGRSCVHPDHRRGGVIMSLWGALFEFMQRNNLDVMVGCATVPMSMNCAHGVVHGGHGAASLWQQLQATHMAPIQYRVTPRLALPIERLNTGLTVEPPALIKGYLRLGTKIMGAPAWDPHFNAADLPMILMLDDMPPRYRKHFLR